MIIPEKIGSHLLRNRWIRRLGLFNPRFGRISRFRECHKHARGFIIGSGPSLKIEDLDRLKNEITFACNKIYLAFDQTDWRPTYYSVIDSMVARNNARVIDRQKLLKIFSNSIRSNFAGSRDIFWLKDLANPRVGDEIRIEFSDNLETGVYGGYSVIYTQMQMAYYMGLKEVYLLGVDFSFEVPAASGDKSPLGETLLYGNGEKNHFHPDYRKQGEAWTLPKLDLQYKAFCRAREAFEADGRIIYNASRHTKLDVFPRIELESIL